MNVDCSLWSLLCECLWFNRRCMFVLDRDYVRVDVHVCSLVLCRCMPLHGYCKYTSSWSAILHLLSFAVVFAQIRRIIFCINSNLSMRRFWLFFRWNYAPIWFLLIVSDFAQLKNGINFDAFFLLVWNYFSLSFFHNFHEIEDGVGSLVMWHFYATKCETIFIFLPIEIIISTSIRSDLISLNFI